MKTELATRFQAIAQSEKPYPVNFDDAWQWVGYARKDSALRAIQENFEEGLDFSTIKGKSTGGKAGSFDSTLMWNQTGQGGDRRSVKYFLTTDCFKAFCMMAGTEKGREVRKYYLEVERRYLAMRGERARPAVVGGEAKQIENFLNGFGFNIRFTPLEINKD